MTKTIQVLERGITLPPLPEIDDVTRREFLIGTAGLLLLPAGCGSDGEGGDEASGEMRTVEHALGTTEVPTEPRRVVVIDSYLTLTTALMLGVPVVGATTFQEEGG